jgi:hypothetical protein
MLPYLVGFTTARSASPWLRSNFRFKSASEIADCLIKLCGGTGSFEVIALSLWGDGTCLELAG